MIDIHSHILPGLDDGASRLDTALDMAAQAVEDGIRGMIATPHVFREKIFEENIDQILPALEAFRSELNKRGIRLEVYPGAEVHIAHNLFRIIREKKDRLVLNKGKYILVEFPSRHVFAGVKDLFFNIMTSNLIPVIAHPERNRVFRHNPKMLFELVEMGALVQVNQGSLFGIYGERARTAARRFLEWKFVHFLATDCHNTGVSAPSMADSAQKAEALLGKQAARALVKDNPQAVVESREIPFHPEPVNPDKKKKSFIIKLPFIK